MRASVIWWSAFSGAVLGVFIDATLVGVALLFSTMVSVKAYPRWAVITGVMVLGMVLLAMTALGYVEGKLKAV